MRRARRATVRAVSDQQVVAAAWARGRAIWTGLDLDEGTFARHLASVAPQDATGALSLEGLAIEDLYLACAAAQQIAGAAGAVGARHGAGIRAAIARVVRGADAAEVEQQFMDALLVGSVAAPPKIRSYAGKAPLERWLSVAAQRAALMWIRANRAEARARDGVAAEPVLQGQTHPELSFLKERYRGAFQQALKEALERMPEHERVLLRLHLVNGLTVEKVGHMLGVSQPTASRRLAAARATLLEDIKRTLGSRLGVSSEELASLAGLVASRLDLSLSMLLKSG